MMRSFRSPALLLTALLALAAGGTAHAQDPDEMLTKYRRAFHEEGGVYIQLNTTIYIHRKGEGLVAERRTEKEHITLKTLAGRADREQVNYSGMVPLAKIEAYTLAPNKGNYKKTTVTEFIHKDERDHQIFHDDSRSVNFLFPSVTPGSITHLDYELDYPDARFVNGHFFTAEEPVEHSTLTIVYDKDIEVDARPFHIAPGMLDSTLEDKHGRITRTFTMRNVPALKSADDAPDIRYYAPHIQLVVRDMAKNARDAGLSDIERLYRWYYGHIAGVNGTSDPELAKIAAEATAGAQSDAEKAQRLYAWVQDHIKYVAVEDGENGFVPMKATEVCADRYGDCKGMANLLRALLVNAGLNAHLAWVGSRELPYTYSELATTATDDHMIVVLDLDTTHVFLDATSDQCPYGMPSFYIQGKQVLCSIDSAHFRLLRAPEIPETANTLVDSVHVHVDGNDLVGRGVMRLTGQQRAFLANALHMIPPDKWKDYLRAIHMKYNNRYQPDSITVNGLDDRNAELVLRYSLRIPGAVTTTGNERFLPLDLEFPWRDEHFPATRTEPVEREYRTLDTYVTTLDPSPGITPGHLPDATALEKPRFGYSCTYRAQPNGAVTCTTTYRTGYILLPSEELDGWRTMLDARERELNRSIVLALHP